MLYKVTPMMPVPGADKAKKVREPGQPRKRRKSAIFDGDGHEVLITLMCLKCRSMKPLGQFGLRKMADGAIRNQPWCRTCRGASGIKKKEEVVQDAAPAVLHVVPPEPLPAPAPLAAAPAVVELALGDPLS